MYDEEHENCDQKSLEGESKMAYGEDTIKQEPKKQYQTAFGYSSKELDEAVNVLLADGWELYGSPYMSSFHFQAMVKKS